MSFLDKEHKNTPKSQYIEALEMYNSTSKLNHYQFQSIGKADKHYVKIIEPTDKQRLRTFDVTVYTI